MAAKFDISKFAESLGTVSESDHSEELVHISLDQLVSDENNFYAISDIPDLAANIELCGLQQPLRVRKDGDAYRIVSGHRRRAALELLAKEGKERFATVPCIVESDEVSPAMQELRLIFANSSTRKLSSADLAQQAEQVEKLLYQLKEEGVVFPGRMRDQVAAACKTTGTKLAELKKIRECLEEPFQSQYKQNLLAHSAAYALARLPDYVQKDLAAALGSRAKPIAGVAADNLLQHYKRYYCFENDTTCHATGLHCDNAKGFLKATAKGTYAYDYCSAKCCCDCRSRGSCVGACPTAKELSKQDAADKAAEQEREKKNYEKSQAQHKKANQKVAQRLLRAIDAAGLSDTDRISGGYNFTRVAYVRDWAEGNFGDKVFWVDDEVSPYYATGVRELAEQLHCSADYILGLTDDLTPAAAPCEGQTCIAAWMLGGTTPAHSCSVVMEFDLGEKKNKMLGMFDADLGKFCFAASGDPVGMEPIRWFALPD